MRRPMRRSNQRRGFTLLEVMLVLVIIAAIAGIAVYNIGGIQTTANKMTASNQIKGFKQALETYKLLMQSYPASLDALHEAPADLPDPSKYTPLYKEAIPADPWGRPYEYKLNGADYELRSLGPDGQSGTDDDVTS